MRNRLPTFVVACVLAFAVPVAVVAQTDTALKLSTSVPQAAAEFKAGAIDVQNLSVESGASHFESAMNADPSFGLARVLYAGWTAKLTQPQRIAEMDRGVADAARGSTRELLLAAAYRENFLNRTEAAAALFRAAAELMPTDRWLAFSAATFENDPATQLRVLREFATRNPTYAPAYNTLAYTLWTQGDKAGAIEAAKRQVELNPNAPNPHDTYAEMLQWNGNFAEASAAYSRSAAMAPKFPEAYGGLAEVEAAQGRYDQARTYLNQAIANAWTPQQKLSYMRQIAGTYALQGSSDAALAKQNEAIAREATAQQNLAVAAITNAQLAALHANAGKAAESHQALAAAKAASPEVPWQVHYYGTVAHALMKHFGPATEELNALKARRAASPAVSATLVAAAEGYLMTQQGKPADALKILTAADTTNILIINRIAEAHAALGHSAEASAWNNRINGDYALNLLDVPAAHARRRARGAAR